MPNRNKRNIDDFDPNKSDSNDSTYSASASRPTRSRSTKSHPRKPARKKVRLHYGTDDSDIVSDGDDDLLSAGSFGEEEEEVETDPRTGRPKRQSTKKAVKYDESESEESMDELEDDEEEEPEETKPSKPKKKGSLLLKLNIKSRGSASGPVGRQTRTRSGSGLSGSDHSADILPARTRRSSRIAHDENDPMIALTESGRHAQIIRPGTHSPQPQTRRSSRAGKGLKSVPTRIGETDELAASEEADPTEKPSTEDLQDSSGADIEYTAANNVIEENVLLHEGGGDDVEMSEGDKLAEKSIDPVREEEEDDEDEGPISKGGRANRASRSGGGNSRSSRKSERQRKRTQDESSDFEPNPDEPGDDEITNSDASAESPRKGTQRTEDSAGSSTDRRSRRLAKGKTRSSGRSRQGRVSEDHDSEELAEELAEELEDLRQDRPRRKPREEILYDDKPNLRGRKTVDYRIFRPDLAFPTDEPDPPPAATPRRRGGGGSWARNLFSTYGPFGGAGGPLPVLGGPGAVAATGGVDSDSSDDEMAQRPRGIGGSIGMTPTSGATPGLFPTGQLHGADPLQGTSGTPANLGKIKDKQTLADADPLGVDQNVNFDSVGGLQEQIDQLKEMVSLPLLYPEIFSRFHVTPPRGVLFHGPPGTGKTLLARALASSVSSHGRKVTFYMRKGADALSKWVGEAERQLRLLFEEARRTQPSIIFFDEIDGLAPVRSSKQEQIHASIVSTLLALMDGMDGRGQVIVIGATNRPDAIDPALRRPGRFDREFYFPLPAKEARRSIIDIHTKGWNPPLDNSFKDDLAELTKGYGGADLRALCTEAALNAVQRRYPQIYASNEKLIIDPSTINVTAKDFMISVKKLVPSSERSISSGASPLPQHIEPLLREPLAQIQDFLAEVIPQKKKLTALEEAQFEDPHEDRGFQRERMQQDFERSRVFRPRLLIQGRPGMGQHYIAAAILNHFENLHVQSFDLPTLLSDSTRTPEAAVVQLFAEVRRHKPSVIYIPHVDTWYRTVGSTVISTFLSLLRGLPPTDPVLLLGIMESDPEEVDKAMVRDLFGYSRKNQYSLPRTAKTWRYEFFESTMQYIRTSPKDFPDPENRKKRTFEVLKVAPAPQTEKEPTADELKQQKKKDRQTLNLLKIKIQPIMDQIKLRYKKFRTGVVDDSQIRYLQEEEDPDIVSSDLPLQQRQQQLFRPYEKHTNSDGVVGLLEVASNKFFYNLNIQVIEERLSNGYYKRPKDFLADIKKLAKDAKSLGDRDRTLKANELVANVEVDMAMLEADPFLADCENVYLREMQRIRDKEKKLQQITARERGNLGSQVASNAATLGSSATTEQQSSGPVMLGESIPGHRSIADAHPVTPPRVSHHSSLSNGYAVGSSIVGEHGSNQTQSNGNSVPSRSDGDVQMTDSEEASTTKPDNEQSGSYSQLQPQAHHIHQAARPVQTQSGVSSWIGPGGTGTQRSQKSAITPMAAGSQVEDYANDASTTSSGKKTSDQSNRSSGPYYNTESSNGQYPIYDGPGFKDEGRVTGDSQMPDTQEFVHSQGSNPHSSQPQARSQTSSQPPVPAFNTPNRNPQSTSIQALLNGTDQEQELTIDEAVLHQLHGQLADRTSGCTIEQLEQINSSLMDTIWKTRGMWNRTQVALEVQKVFNEVMLDIQEMQSMQSISISSQ